MLLIIVWMALTEITLFNFAETKDLSGWRVVDDVVMGGRSQGDLDINSDGNLDYRGRVSLENNGGFSSIRHEFRKKYPIGDSKSVRLRIKGDGHRYQLRIKHDRRAYWTYTADISTTGEWQTIEVPLSTMRAVFRGRRLDISNFDHQVIAEIGFLIGNKKAQDFRLQVESIELI